jgi:hypothetical protein
MAASQGRKGFFQKFTAVDLIIIAVFSLLFRFVFTYIYKALYVVFPWNQAVSPAFMSFTIATMLVLVPKPGTVLLWTVVSQLINLFFQGEDPAYLVGVIPVPFIVEAVFWLMKRWGDDLVSSLVGNMVNIGLLTIWNWYALVYIFLIPYSIGLAVVVFLISVLVTSNLGAWLGFQVGKQLKRLMG